MKRCVQMILCAAVLMGWLCSCARPPFIMLNSSGIATYNRHTGQFEVLWEHTEKQVKLIHDTIYVDSCRISNSREAYSY